MRSLHVDTATTWRGGQNQVLLTVTGLAERGHQAVLAAHAGGLSLLAAAGNNLLDTRYLVAMVPPAALLAETTAFVEAIVHDAPVQVSGRDGYKALELAESIIEKIEQRA